MAGGLGERLGYDGIKVGIPIDLVTKQTFLEYYCNYVLTCQQKYANKGELIPFAIMTSDDTHALTVKILQENDYFGLNKGIHFVVLRSNLTPQVREDSSPLRQWGEICISSWITFDRYQTSRTRWHSYSPLCLGSCSKMDQRKQIMVIHLLRYQSSIFKSPTYCSGSK